MKKHNQVNC